MTVKPATSIKPRFAPVSDGMVFSTQSRLTRFAATHTYESLGYITQAAAHAERCLMWLVRVAEADDMLLERRVYAEDATREAKAASQRLRKVLAQVAAMAEVIKTLRTQKIGIAQSVEAELEDAYAAELKAQAIAHKPKAAAPKGQKQSRKKPENKGVNFEEPLVPAVVLDMRKIAKATEKFIAKETAGKPFDWKS